MEPIFDLLGDPIPEGWGRRGRPAHIPTQENRSKIRMLLAFGWTDERIARALRITRPTLRKHYFTDLRHRDEARDALEAVTLAALFRQVQEGNVGAIKEMDRKIEKMDLAHLAKAVSDRGEAKPIKLGKKEQRREAAGQVGGKYAPPAPPSLIN